MKVLSEEQLQGAATSSSRIIAAEALRGVASFAISELDIVTPLPQRHLSVRDLGNETARAAYALGRRRGFEQGARTGLQQGYSEGSQALEDFQSRKAADVAGQMQQLVDGFRGELAALVSQVASDLVSLAIDIARQVLRRELDTDAQAVLPAATEALRALAEGASQLELRVNPADAPMLRQHLEGMPQARRWQVSEDNSLQRGGCRVEADTGVADASFEARWQAVMASLGRDEEPLP
jgi:flagellar assembly protein FliH